ncbi:Ig-like domain-containing protein, partial [Idiomarina seosinensis]
SSGNQGTVTGTSELDTTAPSLTVDAESGSDATPSISGTSDEEGATVTVVITDANGVKQELEATVTDGEWSVDVPAALADGDYTVTATVADAAGNSTDADTTGNIDTTAPGETAGDGNSIAFTDSLINANESTGVELTGAVENGATIDSIIITDADDNEVVVPAAAINVDADGNITISGLDLSELADGELTVTMSVTDSAGNNGNVEGTTTLATELPTIGGLNASGEMTVAEAFISGGTRQGQGQPTGQGSFTISSGAYTSVASITLAGATLTMTQLLNANANPVTINTDEGSFTVTGYDSATGEVSYSYTLSQAQQHGAADNMQLNHTVTVTDTAGQTTNGNLVINVTDDEPLSFNPEIAEVEDGFIASLNINAGADGIADIRFTVTAGEQIFDVDGNPILYTDGTTSGGTLYFTYAQDASGNLDDSILIAENSDGSEIFRITLNQADGTYSIDITDGVTLYTQDTIALQAEEFEPVTSIIEDDDYDMLAVNVDANEGDEVLLFSGHFAPNNKRFDIELDNDNGITIDSSSDSNSRELIRADFIDNMAAGSMLDIVRYRQTVNVDKQQSNIAISVFSNVNQNDIGDKNGGDQIDLTLANIRVYDEQGADITDSMDIRIDDGRIEIKGMLDGYSFEVLSDSPFQALQVESIDANGFTLGDFSFAEELSYEEIALLLGIEVEDLDGDVVASQLPIGDIEGINFKVGGNEDSSIEGTEGDDIILGDRGGFNTIVEPGTNYNVSIMLDTSGSMGYGSGVYDNAGDELSRLDIAKDALTNLLTQLAGHDGIINVQIVGFDKFADEAITINNLSQSTLPLLLTKVEALIANGGTNYSAAFAEAIDWFNDLSDSQHAGSFENVSYFLTDGEPTYVTLNDSTYGYGSGTSSWLFQKTVDSFKDLSELASVNAIGLGKDLPNWMLDYFDNTANQILNGSYGTFGDATIVTDAEQLQAALTGGDTERVLGEAGTNTIEGGAGKDVIFANGVNSDHLSWTDGAGNTFSAGSHDGLGLTGLREYLRWEVNAGEAPSDQQVMNYIRSNWLQLAEGRADDQGGNNIIDAGSGDDVIIGGNQTDIIRGGEGNDIMQGGDGSDVFVFDTNDAGTIGLHAEDVITDFTLANETGAKDVLDLSGLLDGENASNIGDYIVAEDDGQGNTVLYINSQGELNGHDNADQVVTLQDAAMAEGQSSEGFIEQLLSDGQLLIDSGSSASQAQHSSNPLDEELGSNSIKHD